MSSAMVHSWLSGGTTDWPKPRMSKRATGWRAAMIGSHSAKMSRLAPTP